MTGTGMVLNMEIVSDVTELHLRWINDVGIGVLCLPILSPFRMFVNVCFCFMNHTRASSRHFVKFTIRGMNETTTHTNNNRVNQINSFVVQKTNKIRFSS